MAYRWNEASGRYTDPRTGRFVSERTVRQVVDAVADLASDRLEALARRLLDGQISLAEWQAESMRVIRLAHTSAAVIAHGGAEQMTPSRWGAVGQRIRSEYGFLRGMAQDIASGRQALDGRLVARARQYGQGARVTFERSRQRDQRGRGYRFERNVLGQAEHCQQCREQTSRGWVPIGSLVPVGSRTCRSLCRCTIRYSREMEQAA